MPTLPNPDEFQRRGVSPRGGIIQYEGGIKEKASAGAALRVGAAQEEIGRAVGQVGEVVGRAVEREQQRLDKVLIDSSENELMGLDTELSIRARQVKGQDVLSKDYITGLEKEYTVRSKQIEDKLQTTNQKAAFKSTSDRALTSFLRGVATHAAGEADKAKETGYKARIEAAVGMAAAQPENDEAMHDSIGIVVASAMLRADELGLDPTARDQFIQEAHGSVVAATIDSKRNAGLVEEARQLFEVSRGVMTDDQIKGVEHRLKPVVESTFGSNLADEVFALKESGALSAVEAQKLINERTKGRPEANTAAEVALRELERRKKEDTDDKVGSVLLKFQEADATEAAFLAATKSPEFLELEPAVRGKLYQDLRTQVRVVARAEKADDSAQWKTQEVLERYYEVANDPDLGKKTPNQIAALALEIGPANTARVAAKQKELLKGTSSFRLDTDLINEAMPKDLRTATKSSGTKFKQADAFRGIVEANLADWKARNPGAVPTVEQQKKIARSALAEYEEDRVKWWPGKTKTPLYAIDKDQWIKDRREEAKAEGKGALATDDYLENLWNKFLLRNK